MQGVKAIHEANFIHLDLKPANIFVTFTGSLKIGDFGLASRWPAPKYPSGVSIPHHSISSLIEKMKTQDLLQWKPRPQQKHLASEGEHWYRCARIHLNLKPIYGIPICTFSAAAQSHGTPSRKHSFDIPALYTPRNPGTSSDPSQCNVLPDD